MVQFLAFGASFTKKKLRKEFEPYACSLQTELQNAFPERKFEIIVAGFSGDLVEALLSVRIPENYDYVAIMNKETHGLSRDNFRHNPVFNKLQELHNQFMVSYSSSSPTSSSSELRHSICWNDNIYFGGSGYGLFTGKLLVEYLIPQKSELN